MDTITDRASDFTLKEDSGYVIFQPNHPLMAKRELRQQDLKPQRIFFYVRLDHPNEQPQVYTEKEAAMLEKSSVRPVLRMWGCSDGSAYQKSLQNCGVKTGERITKERMKQILDDAMNAEIESAKGHYDQPLDQNIQYGGNFPVDKRSLFLGFTD